MNGSLLKRASALAAAAALASTTALSSGLAANAATSAPDPKPAVSADRKAANDALKTVRDLLTPMSAGEAQAARDREHDSRQQDARYHAAPDDLRDLIAYHADERTGRRRLPP